MCGWVYEVAFDTCSDSKAWKLRFWHEFLMSDVYIGGG